MIVQAAVFLLNELVITVALMSNGSLRRDPERELFIDAC
jgi:hypothetical protein